MSPNMYLTFQHSSSSYIKHVMMMKAQWLNKEKELDIFVSFVNALCPLSLFTLTALEVYKYSVKQK